jgi:hypothetical protein
VYKSTTDERNYRRHALRIHQLLQPLISRIYTDRTIRPDGAKSSRTVPRIPEVLNNDLISDRVGCGD